MKKLLIPIIILLTTLISLAQAQVKEVTPNGISQNFDIAPYRLFPTENTWNFIKLDTRNGKMWIVQWSTEPDKRFTYDLSLISLVTNDNEKNGRFTLQPTKNIYNFILIDQLDGRTWQVQWSFDSEKRMVIPIN